MKIVMFYHSLVSDWNHGNAHFLRGIMSELILRGHDVRLYEPANSWSAQNLWAEHGEAAIARFHEAYPTLRSWTYRWTAEGFGARGESGAALGRGTTKLCPGAEEADKNVRPTKSEDKADKNACPTNLDDALAGADLVIVHEWSDHELVRRIGAHHARHPAAYHLLFHDTHHRAITSPAEMGRYDLAHYDGVLAYGRVLRDLYLARGWARRAWTWHEAADTRVFRPIDAGKKEGDVVWIGNWGDDERTAELHEFLLGPIKELGLKARIHGVRYPAQARAALAEAGIEYGGWLANFDAPAVFAKFKVTVHVPRRPYVEALRGIPTIRPFEALACGIPLISSPWEDCEGLFTPGEDYLVARNGEEMKEHLRRLLNDPESARQLAAHGHRTALSRHTCAHRVDELMEVVAELSAGRGKKNPGRRLVVERPVSAPA